MRVAVNRAHEDGPVTVADGGDEGAAALEENGAVRRERVRRGVDEPTAPVREQVTGLHDAKCPLKLIERCLVVAAGSDQRDPECGYQAGVTGGEGDEREDGSWAQLLEQGA